MKDVGDGVLCAYYHHKMEVERLLWVGSGQRRLCTKPEQRAAPPRQSLPAKSAARRLAGVRRAPGSPQSMTIFSRFTT